MQQILCIRFGALGDLCLLGWTLSRLANAPDAGRVRSTLVTKARLAGLAGHLAGVDQVVALDEPGGLRELWRLAAQLRQGRYQTVIDAHQVLRSRLLLGLIGRRPAAVLNKDTVARLRLLRGGQSIDPALQRHMRDRFDDLLDTAGLTGGPASPPLISLAPPPSGRAAILGLAPGAQWDPKRWPPAHWADLVRRFRAASDQPLRVFLGPRERAWFAGSELESALAAAAPVEIIQDRPLTEVATLLGGCRLLVCNDSGLLHLAEAVSTPVVACFGPTVAAFGYTPHLPASTVLEVMDLDCRPCSRHGKRPCHRRDLACLVRITPDEVWRAVSAHGPWTENRS
jgi:heptosyltransferase II